MDVCDTNWASGEPNNGTNYNRALLRYSQGLWQDHYDTYTAPGIVELGGSGYGEGFGPGRWSQYVLDIDIADLIAPTVLEVSSPYGARALRKSFGESNGGRPLCR